MKRFEFTDGRKVFCDACEKPVSKAVRIGSRITICDDCLAKVLKGEEINGDKSEDQNKAAPVADDGFTC
jgi:ribosomal protein L37AE/L43A